MGSKSTSTASQRRSRIRVIRGHWLSPLIARRSCRPFGSTREAQVLSVTLRGNRSGDSAGHPRHLCQSANIDHARYQDPRGHTKLMVYLFALGQLFDVTCLDTSAMSIVYGWLSPLTSFSKTGRRMLWLNQVEGSRWSRRTATSCHADVRLAETAVQVCRALDHSTREVLPTNTAAHLAPQHRDGGAPVRHCTLDHPDFSLAEFQQIVPEIRRMHSAWIAGHTRGLGTANHGGNAWYIHAYFGSVDDGVMQKLQQFLTGDDVEEALFLAISNANYVAKLLRLSEVVRTPHRSRALFI